MAPETNAQNVVVQFPDASRDFQFPDDPLAEGDVIWHEGERYRVRDIASRDGAGPIATVEIESHGPDDNVGP